MEVSTAVQMIILIPPGSRGVILAWSLMISGSNNEFVQVIGNGGNIESVKNIWTVSFSNVDSSYSLDGNGGSLYLHDGW